MFIDVMKKLSGVTSRNEPMDSTFAEHSYSKEYLEEWERELRTREFYITCALGSIVNLSLMICPKLKDEYHELYRRYYRYPSYAEASLIERHYNEIGMRLYMAAEHYKQKANEDCYL